MSVKTHTFAGKNGKRTYKIAEVDSIDGVTDVPGEPEMLEMMILNGTDLRSLHSALHEGLEGIDCCDECIHSYGEREDGNPVTWDVARLLWRLGYRKTE